MKLTSTIPDLNENQVVAKYYHNPCPVCIVNHDYNIWPGRILQCICGHWLRMIQDRLGRKQLVVTR